MGHAIKNQLIYIDLPLAKFCLIYILWTGLESFAWILSDSFCKLRSVEEAYVHEESSKEVASSWGEYMQQMLRVLHGLTSVFDGLGWIGKQVGLGYLRLDLLRTRIIDRVIDRHTNRQQAGRQTGRQTNKQASKQTNRWIGKQQDKYIDSLV